MPVRDIPLVTNEFYHVLNRGVALLPIFNKNHDFKKFIETLQYYQNVETPIRFSKFNSLPSQERSRVIQKLQAKGEFLVEIVTYCLMPNHFHMLLRQIKDDGILNFIRLICNSYSRYFNTKYKRKGSLFEGRFKAVRIENDYQLLHVSRYIHLNPYSSFLTNSLEELEKYPFSSLREYLSLGNMSVCSKEIVLTHFKNAQGYKKFITDQADYQRTLDVIKHKALDN